MSIFSAFMNDGPFAQFQWGSFLRHVIGGVIAGAVAAWTAGGEWKAILGAALAAGLASAKAFIVVPKG
jgi:hypothetical protein